ncbi:MAG: RagB/SusD family nutrient uptake outer membrane protein [Porphyromonas sp.]
MKNRYIIGMLSLCALAMTSCQDTLDTHPTEIYDEAVVWGSRNTAQAFINNTLNNVITQCGYAGGGSCIGWEARTPNAMRCSQVGEGIDNFANELGINNNSDFGANRFALLRQCNLIFKNLGASTAINEVDKKPLLAQAHLLRGMIFFDQAKKMGRFVPVTQVFDAKDSSAVKLPMTKDIAESYKYVISDLEAAAENMPKRSALGLPTKWSVDVILSRACLQAYAYTKDASYLDKAIKAAEDVINNSGINLSTSTGLFNETDATNSEILWAYYRLSSNTTIGSLDELIRIYPNISAGDQNTSKSPNKLIDKSGRTFEGWSIYFPTQDLVDQFLAIDEKTGKALPWYETSQYLNNVEVLDPNGVTTSGQVDTYQRTDGGERRIPTPQDLLQTKEGYPVFKHYAKVKQGVDRTISDIMYNNRDRRFNSTVIHDGSSWCGETVETQLAGNLSQGVRDKEDGGWYNTTTGYYWRKNSIETPEPRAYYNCKVEYHYNIARLAEAYLNLAEAQLLKHNVSAAVTALNKTRTIHGGLPASTATSEQEAWQDYIRERNCEMTNEGGDIYFSYLRWGMYGGYANHGRSAGDVIYDLDRPTYKVEISRDRKSVLIGQHTLLNSATRSFTARRYLLPIAQGFLNTRESYGLDHAQNTGW